MPTLAIRPFSPDTPNDKVFNALRFESTPDFQARIPAATQAQLTAQLNALNSYTPSWNEFVAAIINKVGLTIARNNSWTNPLAIFKRGLLNAGESIEEIQTGLAEAYVFDWDQDYGEKAIWAKERPEVQADYHKINRENFYKITVQKVALQRAFLSDTGLAQFINQLMESPTTSDNWDEYLLMRQLFPEYERRGGFFKWHVPAIPEDETAAVYARQSLRQIRTAVGKLGFLSRQYNAARMPVSAQPDQLVLITTPEFLAAIDVEALAPLFNVQYAEITQRIVVVDDLLIPDVQAILTTEDFFVVADTFFEMTQAPNPVGLHENFFLHHHGIISFSRFVPAIAFTTGPGTVIDVNDPPVTSVDVAVVDVTGTAITEVERGASYEVQGEAITTPEGGVSDAVTLTLTGNESTRTYLTQKAVLHVSADETAEALTVTAVNTDFRHDNDATPAGPFTKSVELTVSGEIAQMWPDPSVLPDPDDEG